MDFQKIPLDLVKPSPMNPRKTFDEEAVNELAANIEKQGLIQPITVRPYMVETSFDTERNEPIVVNDGYEIVCGERRYRAYCLLKAKEDALNVERVAAHRKKHDRFQSIPAMVREMNDEEAFDAMITENLQRKDVDPIEEAFAFGQLIKTGKTVDEIAARFGKSIRFVTERVKLNTLVPELMLAVKEEKMPIVAAQIICKLDEEQQKRYYSQFVNNYNGFTKNTAQGFVDNLFMSIDKSVWFQTDDQADEDFSGGCDRKCSECPLNTANHGCLFYEMKSDGSGRCTDREKFRSKTIAFMLHEIEKQSDRLVRHDEPLEYGKTVIGIKVDSYEAEESKTFKEHIKRILIDRGYEVVNPDTIFRSKCWYSSDDERTLEMIKSGEVYRVINLFNYDRLTVEEQYWYIRKNSESDSNSNCGLPVNVTGLLDKLKNENNGLSTLLTIECAKAMSANSTPTNEPLTEIEKQLFSLLVIQSNYKLRHIFGLGQASNRDQDYKFYTSHPDIFNQCMRAWLQSKVGLGNNPELKQAEPMLDALGSLWCAEEYQKAKEKVLTKHEKSVAKLTKQLSELGYDTEGNSLEPEYHAPSIIDEMLKKLFELKKSHSDALVLFKVGPGYECFGDDAKEVSKILDTPLTSSRYQGKKLEITVFPIEELDANIPKLIRSGKRVAICEELNTPNKSPLVYKPRKTE